MNGLNTLNNLATNLIETTGLDPFTFFIAGITFSVLIWLADLNKGISLDIPGRGQIGASAAVFIFSSVVLLLASEGYQFFFIEIAKTVVSLILVSPIVYALLRR